MQSFGDSVELSGAYDLVVQDTRPMSVGDIFSDEGADGRALLSYIKLQAWSNGHVVMTGASNAGIVDYLAAPGADPSLRGINPRYATGDLLHYGIFNGGAIHAETATVAQYPRMSWQEYASQPGWDRYLIDDATAATVDAAGLHLGGWFDVFGQGTLDSFSRLQEAGGPGARGRQKIIMGPWTHGGSASETTGQLTFPSSTLASSPHAALSDAWRAGTFDDNWSSWDALAPVNVYVMGDTTHPWRAFDRWPPPAVQVPFYLTASKSLAATPGSSAELSFVSDPLHPCPTLGGPNNLCSTGGPFDQRSIESRSDVVVFTSQPTTVAGEIVGRIHADVWIATDLPDVDIVVRMTDVYPDGRSMLVAQGIQRARYRNGTCPQLLLPNEPARARVDLSSTALRVPVGHAVRVIISASAGAGTRSNAPSCAQVPLGPLYAVNPQVSDELTTDPDAMRAGTIRILVGTSTPSALVVPIAGGTTSPPDERPVTERCESIGADAPIDADPDGKLVASGCACNTGGSDTSTSLLVVLLVIRLTRRRPSSRRPLGFEPVHLRRVARSTS
jgi:predicted acyl esterase